jgi:hypothetical protein
MNDEDVRENVRESGRIDVVYTWVDDASPGYRDLLARHATCALDLNPNRTRDNLELLRFSLRSLARFAPWLTGGRIHLVTMRPQVPAWLDTSRVNVVHHDQIFEQPSDLPTFSSFAIVSELDRIPGLSPRFLYLEDDRLFLAPVTLGDFVAQDGRLKLYGLGKTPAAALRDRARSPWDRALAEANHALDGRYGPPGPRGRASVKRAPLFVDRRAFARMREAFPAALRATRRNRFRAPGSVAPEHLYPHFLLHEGEAELVGDADVRRATGYAGLENVALYNQWQLARLGARRPKMACLNDNYGPHPGRAAVEVVRRTLARWLPEASPFERIPLDDACLGRSTVAPA